MHEFISQFGLQVLPRDPGVKNRSDDSTNVPCRHSLPLGQNPATGSRPAEPTGFGSIIGGPFQHGDHSQFVDNYSPPESERQYSWTAWLLNPRPALYNI